MKILKTITLIFLISVSSLSIFNTRVFAAYQKYIDNVAPSAAMTSSKQSTVDELNKVVLDMIAAGHMAPTLIYGGLSSNPLIYYVTPNETIYSLSIAYPYLPSSTQNSLKIYLANEIQNYSPLTNGNYGPVCCKITDFPGTRREAFPINPNLTINFWPGVSVDPSVIYTVWAYSYYTNDWTYATNNYTSIKSIYTNVKNAGTADNYQKVAGIIGFGRIAKQLNKTTDYNDAVTYGETSMTAAANFNQYLNTSNARFPLQTTLIMFLTTIFMFSSTPVAVHFNKDLGLFLKENSLTAATDYSNKINSSVPLWWLNHSGFTWSENSYAPDNIGWTNFMLRSYVLGDSFEKLSSILDKPERRGDLYYIQKLVATLDAPSTTAPIRGDFNGDGVVGTADLSMFLTNLNTTDPTAIAKYDLNNSNSVDVTDLSILLTLLK